MRRHELANDDEQAGTDERPEQREAAHQVWLRRRQVLRDDGAHRVAEDVGASHVQPLADPQHGLRKGLQGVKTHLHREWIPIFANDQDIPALAAKVEAELNRDPASHGFLLSGHGLYTWGEDLAQARRHIEIFEFLFEVAGRSEFGTPPSQS